MLNRSYWEQEAFFGTPDFTVIGGGLTGMYTACFIKYKFPESDVLILERGPFSAGASTRNAGFACFGSASELLDDISQFGVELTTETLKLRWAGLQLTKKILGNSSIGYEESGGHEVFTNEDQALRDVCIEQLDNLNNIVFNTIGLKDTYSYSKRLPKGCKNFEGSIFNQYEGKINTAKFNQSLLKHCNALGIRFLFGFDVYKFESEGSFVKIYHQNYGSFKTNKLLITNNGFAGQFLQNEDVKAVRNQVLLTSEIKSLKLDGCFNLYKGYFYFRNVGNRVLFGGGRHLLGNDENTSQMSTTHQAQELLTNMIEKHIEISEPYTIEYHWSGILGIGHSKRPVIKKIEPNVYAGVRMGGMGVAICSEVGRKLADLVLDDR